MYLCFCVSVCVECMCVCVSLCVYACVRVCVYVWKKNCAFCFWAIWSVYAPFIFPWEKKFSLCVHETFRECAMLTISTNTIECSDQSRQGCKQGGRRRCWRRGSRRRVKATMLSLSFFQKNLIALLECIFWLKIAALIATRAKSMIITISIIILFFSDKIDFILHSSFISTLTHRRKNLLHQDVSLQLSFEIQRWHFSRCVAISHLMTFFFCLFPSPLLALLFSQNCFLALQFWNISFW